MGETIIQKFYEQEKNKASKPFLHQPFGDKWETYTYKEVGQMARKVANHLKSIGMTKGKHIGLVSKNCREWIIADLAIMMAECISVPFFPTLSGEQINQVLHLGDVDLLIVGKLEVWDDMKKGIPDDMPIIKFPDYPGNDRVDRGTAWEDILSSTPPLEGHPSAGLDDLWTIVFTSGTTGTPKGVMLNYSAPYSLLEETKEYNALNMSLEGEDRLFSYLPLNHIAERAIVESGALTYGSEIFFTESLAMFAQNLRDAKPTIFFAVPRIWTKLMLGILDKMPQDKLSRLLKIPFVSGMVKKKIKSGLGLQKSKTNVSGAAPIPQSTKDWFAKIGLPISEGYGMTENCAACTFLKVEESRPGSVGKAQPGVEMRIDPDTEEILMRAPFVMQGYYKSPEKTAETIVDGWLHTGDQGRIDKDGFLFITGRVKDTFKTSKGEFIVPARIEDKFSHNADIEQMCLLGLGIPQPVLTVVPSEIGMAKSKEELTRSLTKTLDEVNKALPNYERVSAVVVTKEPFSIESGTLTPTLKVKRTKVHQKYKDRLLADCECPDKIIFE
jgi:long-subunit acyl-CoA synthetase (AMP-forming)